MTLDYTSHPAEIVGSGEVKGVKKMVTIDDLKRAIPAYCFKPTYTKSLFFLVRDLLVISAFGTVAWSYIPQIQSTPARYVAWIVYGYIQGLAFTGFWVLGHECGHGSFSPSKLLNNSFGWVIHSSLMTPYFAWQSTHRRHHIYANNLAKDHNYVPPQAEQYASVLGISAEQLESLDEMTEDAPLAAFGRIVMQQLLGWPMYLVNNITASAGSLYGKQSDKPFGNSHLNPWSTLFRPEEAHLMIASDMGLALTAGALYVAGQKFGFASVALMYGQPYLWLNHWIVAITYLHHTHPEVPKYRPEAWTFIKGALATVDRNLGFAGQHMLHNIADYHVIHHLFSRIPHYYAKEATEAIQPLLGKQYHEERGNFNAAMWDSFHKCQWVKADDVEDEKERAYWFKAGPIPPPERDMKKRSWI